MRWRTPGAIRPEDGTRCPSSTARPRNSPRNSYLALIVKDMAKRHDGRHARAHAFCKSTRRPASRHRPRRLFLMFSPARVLPWIRVSRMTLVFGIFVAAMLVWRNADAHARTLAGAALVTTALFTAFSAWYERRRLAPPGSGFHSLQLGFDVLLVTFAVHLTGGALSPFTALYILVTAAGAFLLRPGGALLVAAAGAYLSARLQQDGESRDAIEAQLVLAKLQAEDVLQTIRSGIVTVDARGRILFANASAGA